MRFAFVASDTSVAQQARRKLVDRYDDVPPEQAELIVALGGDGFMLRTLHAHRALEVPVYGMKLGRVGFLMNKYRLDELPERIERAEVSLLRQSNQAAHLEVQLNGEVKLTALVCDGIMVSTPAGSTAYNLSAHGPILPLDANVLALTPISPFRPRRWRGAILPHRTEVILRVLDPGKRPVSATADFHEVRDVRTVSIRQSGGQGIRLLFDPEHSLEQRILDEQFAAE
jgi:NAD+ kinase